MNQDGLFKTKRLHAAAYLLAASVLRYRRAEYLNGRTVFVFEDPDGIGPEAERAFDHQAVCPASELFSALTYLRRQIDAVRPPTGEQHEQHASR